MKVSFAERVDLLDFLKDLQNDTPCEENTKKCKRFIAILEPHQVHTKSIRIHNHELKEFIREVRSL